MAIQLIEQFSDGVSGAQHTFTLVDAQVDDVVLLIQADNWYELSNLITPTGTAVTTWTEQTANGLPLDGGTNDNHVRVWTGVVTTVDGTVIANRTQNDDEGYATAFVFRDAQFDTCDGTETDTSATSHVAPSVTPESGKTDDYLICVWGTASALTNYTVPGTMTPYTERDVNGINTYRAASEQLTSDSATGTRSATSSANTTWFGVSVLMKTASVVTPKEASDSLTISLTESATAAPPVWLTAGLTVTPVSNSQLDLDWNDIVGATYDIERDDVVIVTGHTTNSYSDTGLDAGTEYTYRVGVGASWLEDPPFITSVDASDQFFKDQYGQPIMLRAFSIWMLFSHAGRWGGTAESVIDAAIADLVDMGANALMVKTFSHTTFGSEDDTGNTHDDIAPFVGGDIGVLNNTFWTRFDYLLNKAAENGITVLVNMAHATSDLASGGILDGETSTAMGNYGEALGDRYKDFPNIIWMVGGDYFDTLNTQLTALIDGLATAGDTHLVSVQYYAESTSRKNLDNNTTLNLGTSVADFNFGYSYNVSYDVINHAFGEASPIPVAWMDGYYDQNTAGSRKLLRDQVCWCISSGGRGSMYGSEALWQWNSGAASALSTQTFPSTDQARIWDIFESLDGWHLLRPDTDDSFLTAGRGTHAASYVSGGGGEQYTPADTQDEYITAGVTPDGSLAVVYFPVDNVVTVDDTELVASYTVRWIDPTDGSTQGESIASTYSPPGLNSLGGEDWLLVFEAA